MVSSIWHAINDFSCASIFVRKFSTNASAKVKQINHNQQSGLSAVSKVFPPILYYSFQGEWVVKTTASSLIPLLTFLKRHTATQYRQLIDLTVIDHPKRKLRFEVVYQLLSIVYSQRLSISVSVTEGQALDSATSVYSSAGWYERESWDRFGVFFRNHPDLRRRLTDYGFKGHPLRKDFPVTGFFEVRYNDFRKRILYEKVSLPQEYRIFTLENSWSLYFNLMVGYSLFIILTFVALGSFYYFGRDISQFISKGFLFKTNLTENLPVSTVTDFVSFNKFKQGTKIFSEKVFIPEQTISFTEANTINKKVPLSPTTQVHIWLPSQEKKDHRDLLEISVTSKKQTIDFKTGFKFTDLTKQQYSFNINIKESIPSTEFAQKVKAYTFNSAASSGLTVNTNCSDADSNSVFNTPTSSTPRSPVSSNSWWTSWWSSWFSKVNDGGGPFISENNNKSDWYSPENQQKQREVLKAFRDSSSNSATKEKVTAYLEQKQEANLPISSCSSRSTDDGAGTGLHHDPLSRKTYHILFPEYFKQKKV